MGVGILRLQSGLDFSNLQDEANNTENFTRNQSYSHISQGKALSSFYSSKHEESLWNS